jgi:hypothetical protein
MAFIVQHPLDLQDGLDIALDVEPLIPSTFLGLQEAEFGFPKAQDVCRKLRELTDFTDLIKDFCSQSGFSAHDRSSSSYWNGGYNLGIDVLLEHLTRSKGDHPSWSNPNFFAGAGVSAFARPFATDDEIAESCNLDRFSLLEDGLQEIENKFDNICGFIL